jgi:hypothetical protein
MHSEEGDGKEGRNKNIKKLVLPIILTLLFFPLSFYSAMLACRSFQKPPNYSTVGVQMKLGPCKLRSYACIIKHFAYKL